jgi:uncharacterized membrane protein HdeD (DUF308 family)
MEEGMKQGWSSAVAKHELRENWVSVMALGMAMVFIGLVAMALPFVAAMAIELMIGSLLLVAGIVQGFLSFKAQNWRGFLWEMILAAFYLVVGVWMLVNPLKGMVSIAFVLAVFFVTEGIFKTILAFRIRPVANWGWVMFSGMVTFFLGVVIWAGWPFSAVWMVGFMFGIDMVFGGGSLIMVAMSARRGSKAPEEMTVDCNLHPELC